MNRRDMEDAVLEGRTEIPFDLGAMVLEVSDYQRTEGCTWAAAIEGICEGHELATWKEEKLRAYFAKFFGGGV